MAKYHPDTRFLTDYAAGSLPKSQALCVAAHLHYCPGCKSKVLDLTNVGTALFMQQPPASLDADAFDRVMEKIDRLPEASPAVNCSPVNGAGLPGESQGVSVLPEVVAKITRGDLATLNWRSLGKALKVSQVNIGDDSRMTALMRIKAGGKVPRHTHNGGEITVILKGSFSDQEDHYHLGDFIVRSSGDKHSPVASQDEDCLCLATLDAPVSMTNWFYRLLQPVLGLRVA